MENRCWGHISRPLWATSIEDIGRPLKSLFSFIFRRKFILFIEWVVCRSVGCIIC